MRNDSVVITGLGIVSAAGAGVEATLGALRDGRSGLGPLTRFTSRRCGHLPVAEVRGVEDRKHVPRTVALGRIALREALRSARIQAAPRQVLEQAALVVGTCVAGMPESEALEARIIADPEADFDASIWLRHECAYTTHALARSAGTGGPAVTVSTACSSGGQAIAAGRDLIREGEVRLAIAGGADALCRLTLNGFASLLAVDPDGCRPFDRDRKGMSLGEGAAFVVLESSRSAAERGAQPLAEVAGIGNTCDAHHATAPEPEGRGAGAALREALCEAGVEPQEVDYINAHGTGTPDNDRAEGHALARIFGEGAGTDRPAISSTKRVFGHTLAAAGAIEAVACVLALAEGLLPGTPGLVRTDPECKVEPLRESLPSRPSVVLSNSFGFGGSNVVLCLRHPGRLP